MKYSSVYVPGLVPVLGGVENWTYAEVVPTQLRVDDTYSKVRGGGRVEEPEETILKKITNVAGDHFNVPIPTHTDHRGIGGSELVYLQGGEEEDQVAGEECR